MFAHEKGQNVHKLYRPRSRKWLTTDRWTRIMGTDLKRPDGPGSQKRTWWDLMVDLLGHKELILGGWKFMHTPVLETQGFGGIFWTWSWEFSRSEVLHSALSRLNIEETQNRRTKWRFAPERASRQVLTCWLVLQTCWGSCGWLGWWWELKRGPGGPRRTACRWSERTERWVSKFTYRN